MGATRRLLGWSSLQRRPARSVRSYGFLRRTFGAACESALPAAFFEAGPVRPSRRTLLAALAADGEVLRCLVISITSPLCLGIGAELTRVGEASLCRDLGRAQRCRFRRRRRARLDDDVQLVCQVGRLSNASPRGLRAGPKFVPALERTSTSKLVGLRQGLVAEQPQLSDRRTDLSPHLVRSDSEAGCERSRDVCPADADARGDILHPMSRCQQKPCCFVHAGVGPHPPYSTRVSQPVKLAPRVTGRLSQLSDGERRSQIASDAVLELLNRFRVCGLGCGAVGHVSVCSAPSGGSRGRVRERHPGGFRDDAPPLPSPARMPQPLHPDSANFASRASKQRRNPQEAPKPP